MVKTLESLLRSLNLLEARGNREIAVNGIAYDSRRIQPGDLFVAVRGTRVDANRYVRDALQRGAVAVITESPIENHTQVPFIRVTDSRAALAAVSANFYEHPSRRLTLAGVTGTNGKTTTVLLLESILRSAGHATGVFGTLGHRWGDKFFTASNTTPESLDLQRLFHEMAAEGVTHAVMEVSSHALSLERVGNCAFDAAVFTNLSQDHLDFHGSMEGYFQAKERLFKEHLNRLGKRTSSVINLDDPYGRRLAAEVHGDLWTFSTSSPEARVRVSTAELSATGIRARLSGPVGDFTVLSPLLGRLNLYNVLAAATTAMSLGVPKEAIIEGVHSVSQVDGRLQRVSIPEWCGFHVVVDYAHTPDAMDKSLDCLREMTKGRLVVVFGCGGDRDRTKRPVMGEVAARWGDLVIVTSDNPRTESPEAIVREIEPGLTRKGVSRVAADEKPPPESGYTTEPDRRRAIELALAWARPGDTVFIGGKGHETYQILGTRTLPFDDRLVVKEYFERLASTGQSIPERS